MSSGLTNNLYLSYPMPETIEEIEKVLKDKYNQDVPKDSVELGDYIKKVFPVEIDGYDLQVISSPATTAVKVRYSKSNTHEDTSDDLISFWHPTNPSLPFMRMILWLFENEKTNPL